MSNWTAAQLAVRGASMTTLRRAASIIATANSAGASGEPLAPRDTST